jgi:hypothetical protein
MIREREVQDRLPAEPRWSQVEDGIVLYSIVEDQ